MSSAILPHLSYAWCHTDRDEQLKRVTQSDFPQDHSCGAKGEKNAKIYLDQSAALRLFQFF